MWIALFGTTLILAIAANAAALWMESHGEQAHT
jgi:hypothetical protein